MLHKWKKQKKPQPMKSVRYQTPLTAMLVFLVILLSVVSVAQAKYAQTIPAGSFDLTVLSGEKSYTLMNGYDFYDFYGAGSRDNKFKFTQSLILGNYEDHPEYINDPNAILVGATDSDKIYLHFDENRENAYILADAKIMANPESSYLFNSMMLLQKLVFENFDTSNVVNMLGMFAELDALTELDLSGFNTANVEDMSSLFQGCNNLAEIDLSSFDTSQVTDMTAMFSDCPKLTELDLSNFDTSKVERTQAMFLNCTSLETIYVSEDWNVSEGMFKGCSSLVGGSGTAYATAQVIDGSYAKIDEGPNSQKPGYFTARFTLAPGPEINQYVNDTAARTAEAVIFGYNKDYPDIVAGSNTGVHIGATEKDKIYLYEVDDTIYILSAGKIMANQDCSKMFSWMSNSMQKIIFGNFDTSNVTDMSEMFYSVPQLKELDVTGFNTSNVTNMKSMFNTCRALTALDVTGFDSSKVTDMEKMFYGCFNLLELDLSGFDVSQVTNTKEMFRNSANLKTIYAAEDWTISGDSTSMFSNCKALEGGNGTSLANNDNILDGQGAKIDRTDMKGYFTDISEKPEPSYTLMPGLDFFRDYGGLDVNKSKFTNTKKIVFGYYKDYPTLKNAPDAIHVGNTDADKIYLHFDATGENAYFLADGKIMTNSDASNIFSCMQALQSIDFHNFDTSNATDMNAMFGIADNLIALDLSGFNTSNVINMSNIFRDCKALTDLNLTGFDTSQLTSMSGMFQDCEKLTTLDLSMFNTSNVYSMGGMFEGCSALTSLNLSSFDFSEVDSAGRMFLGCSSLTKLDLGGFVSSEISSMDNMFENCSALTELDLSGITTNELRNTRSMFAGCTSLRTVYASKDWSIKNADASSDMFKDCTSLKGGNGTTLATNNNITNIYGAKIDRQGVRGMFTGSYILAEGTKVQEWMEDFNCNEVIFGFNKDYPEVLGTYNFYNIDADEEGVIKIYFIFSDDSSKCTAYILSAGKILANPDSSKMFKSINSLTNITFENFDTSRVINMESMFDYCANLTSLDVSGFNTSNVTGMGWMFRGLSFVTELDVTGFDTSKVIHMSDMFFDSPNLKMLDLSNFDVSNVTNMVQMFGSCDKLETIYVGDNWKIPEETNTLNMFYWQDPDPELILTGGEGTKWSNDHIDGEYARIDDPANSKPGYFTHISKKHAGNAVNMQNESGRYAQPAPISPAPLLENGPLDKDEPESESSTPVAPREPESSAFPEPSSPSLDSIDSKQEDEDK